MRRLVVSLAVLLSAIEANGAWAQTVSVTGIVSDAVSSRPLVGALVTLGAPANERTTRTDERGGFIFDKVASARYTLLVRRLGYEPVRDTIDVKEGDAPILITLTRVASLDTVRVVAAQQGIYGAVATARDLRPLRAATVQIIGAGGGRIPVDSTAHFFVPIKSPGSFLVRARAPGYDPEAVSVTVHPGEGVEVAMLLDSATSPPTNRFEMAIADFDDRLRIRGRSSALVSRAELLASGDHRTVGAIQTAPSFVSKVLRFTDTVCVYVDGRPMPGWSLNAFEPSQIEAVEVYGEKGDATGTLARGWPRGTRCGDTGNSRTAPGSDVVRWVVIWLKQ